MKKGLFLTLIFIASLSISLLLVQLSFLSTILLTGVLGITVIIPTILSISLLTYFSITSFNTKKITNLILMVILSVLALIPAFFINSQVRTQLTALNNLISELGGMAPEFTSLIPTADSLISFGAFAFLVIITFNIIPIIGLFIKTDQIKTIPSVKSRT